MWDVSNVNNMEKMFYKAYSFNNQLTGTDGETDWDVSKVKGMQYMFTGATAFNIDLSKWDVSKVASMKYMFSGATAFSHTLCGAAWVRSTASKLHRFTGSKGKIDSKCAGWCLAATVDGACMVLVVVCVA